MTNPLQAKDDQWRNRKENASVPVFDPGMSPLGTDDEAGGARAAPVMDGAAQTGAERPPLPATPGARLDTGVRAPPRAWYAAAAVLALVLLIVAWFSFAG
jgi:hypothetical protein